MNWPKECILWTRYRDRKGYGVADMCGHSYKVHRAVYQIFVGELQPKKFVIHTCDNPSCINPTHLRLGTPKDNSTDMVNKRRSATGEQHGRAKLTWGQVQEIRRIYLRRNRQRNGTALGKRYGVSFSTINGIIRGELWKVLTPSEPWDG